MNARIGFAVLGWALLEGCSSVTVRTATPPVDTPEVQGTRSYQILAKNAAAPEWTLANDASLRPPDLTQGSPDSTSVTQIGVGMNFLELVSADVGGWDYFNGYYGHVEVQLLGEPREKSKPGDFSLAVSGLACAETTTQSGNQNGTFGPGGYPWKSTSNSQSFAASVSVGVRLAEVALLFFSGGTGSIKASGKISQDAANGDPGGNFTIPSQSGKTSEAAIGLDFGRPASTIGLQIIGERSWSKLGTQSLPQDSAIFAVIIRP